MQIGISLPTCGEQGPLIFLPLRAIATVSRESVCVCVCIRKCWRDFSFSYFLKFEGGRRSGDILHTHTYMYACPWISVELDKNGTLKCVVVGIANIGALDVGFQYKYVTY